MKTPRHLLLSALPAILVLCGATSEARPLVKLVAPSGVATNAEFLAAVTLSNGVDVAGFEADVGFDCGRFELLSVTPGGYLGAAADPSATRWILPEPASANSNGWLRNVACARVGTNTVSGDGVLFSLRFRERGGGASASTALRLDPEQTHIVNSAGAFVPAELRGFPVTVLGDSDRDGLPDAWELGAFGTTDYGGEADPDGDGESNADELAAGTEGNNAASAAASTNRYDNFRFEIIRNAIQVATGTPEAVSTRGVCLLCGPPRNGDLLRAGMLVCPADRLSGDHRQLEMTVSSNQAIYMRNDFESEGSLQGTFGAGTYRVDLDVEPASGSITQRVSFAFEVPAYSEADFPPFEEILAPIHGSNGVPRNPVLEFGSTNWDYTLLLQSDGQRNYAAIGGSSATHRVAARLDGGRSYWLVVDRNDNGQTWLASRTWAAFSTATEWVLWRVFGAHGAALQNGCYLLDLGESYSAGVPYVAVDGGTQWVSRGWQVIGHEPIAGTTNQLDIPAITNSADLVWIWNTNYWFHREAEPHGRVDGSTSGWYAVGAPVSVSGTADPYFRFAGWQGDVPAGLAASNPLALHIHQPRSVTAAFDPVLASLGTPLWWLAQWGWDTNSSSAELDDPDADHFETWKEYRAGTDPTNPASFFAFAGQSAAASGVVLRWHSASGRLYRVQRCDRLTDLLAASTLASNLPATPPMNVYTDLTVSGSGPWFYRVGLE